MTIPSRFAGYPLGALCGVLAFLIERLLDPTPPIATVAASYSVLFGLLGAAARAVVDRLSAREPERRTLYVLAAGQALHLLYVANILLLPGTGFLHWKSLAADALLLAAVVGLAWAASRSGGVRWSETARGQRAAAVANLVLGAAAACMIVPHWPRPAVVPDSQGDGPNLVLIVIDSARRDHMGVHGYARPTSPSLDAVALRSRVYDQAYSPSTWTFPSVSEILGFGVTAAKKGEGGPGLQDRLAERGYTTALFSDNGILGRGSRLARGFHRLDEAAGHWLPFTQRIFAGSGLGAFLNTHDRLFWDDRRVVDKAIAWAGARRGPFLLYVHLMDAHVPYRQRAIDGRTWGSRRWANPKTGDPITLAEREDVVAFYDGGLRSADVQVGRLLAAAASWRRPFLAIVTADHGESLGESNRWMHSFSLSPELLRVPLVVTGSGVTPARIAAPVGLVSIRRTLLAAAGAPFQDCPGTDLRTSAGDPVVEGGFPPHLWYRIAGDRKVVLDVRSGKIGLFDPIADPQELRNLALETPEHATRLAEGLGPKRSAAKFSPEEFEALRALGYVH